MLRRGRTRHPTEPLDDYLPRFDRQGTHARDADYARAADAETIRPWCASAFTGPG